MFDLAHKYADVMSLAEVEAHLEKMGGANAA